MPSPLPTALVIESCHEAQRLRDTFLRSVEGEKCELGGVRREIQRGGEVITIRAAEAAALKNRRYLVSQGTGNEYPLDHAGQGGIYGLAFTRKHGTKLGIEQH